MSEVFEFDTVLSVRNLVPACGHPGRSDRFLRSALGLSESHGLSLADRPEPGPDMLSARLAGDVGGIRGFLIGVGGLLDTDRLGPDSIGLLGARGVSGGRVPPDEAVRRELRSAGIEDFGARSWGGDLLLVPFRGSGRDMALVEAGLGDSFLWSTHVLSFRWKHSW